MARWTSLRKLARKIGRMRVDFKLLRIHIEVIILEIFIIFSSFLVISIL